VRLALDSAGVRNAVVPCSSPRVYHLYRTDPLFRALQRNRAQMEARISILKHDPLWVTRRERER